MRSALLVAVGVAAGLAAAWLVWLRDLNRDPDPQWLHGQWSRVVAA